jgi:hypothetical protein
MMKKTLVATLALACAQTALADAPTNEELLELIKKQQAEIEELKQEQNKTKKKVDEADRKIEATADAVENGSGAQSRESLWASKTKIGGYGEHHYNNFEGKSDKIDAHRYVLYFSHDYSDTVRFFSEFELEHSLAGEGKPGEVELEQAYIEWDFAENHSLISGLFLVPVGILNETHEPDTFYGTERNLVENKIIPTTWWETGVMLRGEIAPGLSYDFAIHSGLEHSEANIRSSRQKSANAVANDLAYTGRIKYTAVPGLELAATYQYQEDMSQGALQEASASLIQAHAAYTSGGFGFRALYASWSIDGEEAELLGKDEQEGFYIEPSYKVLENLGLFVRYTSYNNFAGLSGSNDVEAIDYGLNYWLHPNVVFKADFTDYNDEDGDDSLNLGVGWSF